MRVAGQVGQNCLGPCERALGIDKALGLRNGARSAALGFQVKLQSVAEAA
jgi:hypothetical protein